MHKEKKLSVRLGVVAGLISLALLGSTAGTLAWYAYSRTVTLSYVGTSVAGSALVNVGLVDDENYFLQEDLERFNLEREEARDGDEVKSVVFSKSRNGFSLLAIRHYLEKSPYAVDQLHPVTTKSRAIDSTADLNLYASPEFSQTSFNELALKDTYVMLPFAFKVVNENGDYVQNKNIWLTDATVSAPDGAESSIRVYVDGENQFLMQPSDEENHVGSTKVGGTLSLGPGQYFDNDGTKEYCYGEFNNEIQYTTLDPSEYETVANPNGCADDTTLTTFVAKHLTGIEVPNLVAAQPKVQEHYGVGRVIPSARSNGELYHDEVNLNGIPVAKTTTGSKVGFANFTIFIEGWDHSVIDQTAGYEFNLGLKFEIDRV